MAEPPARLAALAVAWPPHVLGQDDVAAKGAAMFANPMGTSSVWPRSIATPGTPLVRRGPYRFVRHPNDWIAPLEIAVLPLAPGQVWIALVWSVANALLVRHRIRVEDAALSERSEC